MLKLALVSFTATRSVLKTIRPICSIITRTRWTAGSALNKTTISRIKCRCIHLLWPTSNVNTSETPHRPDIFCWVPFRFCCFSINYVIACNERKKPTYVVLNPAVGQQLKNIVYDSCCYKINDKRQTNLRIGYFVTVKLKLELNFSNITQMLIYCEVLLDELWMQG